MAEKNGIFVIYGSRFNFYGLGRFPLKNPDDENSYTLTSDCYDPRADFQKVLNWLLVPMDSRTLASCSGETNYYFSRLSVSPSATSLQIRKYSCTLRHLG